MITSCAFIMHVEAQRQQLHAASVAKSGHRRFRSSAQFQGWSSTKAGAEAELINGAS